MESPAHSRGGVGGGLGGGWLGGGDSSTLPIYYFRHLDIEGGGLCIMSCSIFQKRILVTLSFSRKYLDEKFSLPMNHNANQRRSVPRAPLARWRFAAEGSASHATWKLRKRCLRPGLKPFTTSFAASMCILAVAGNEQN